MKKEYTIDKEDCCAAASLLIAICWLVIAPFLLCAFTSGCIYKGGKMTEGTDLSVGISVPATEGTLDLSILNYLSGFRLGVAKNAMMTVDYSVAESNSYFGVVRTNVRKDVFAVVIPCSVSNACANASARIDVVSTNSVIKGYGR